VSLSVARLLVISLILNVAISVKVKSGGGRTTWIEELAKCNRCGVRRVSFTSGICLKGQVSGTPEGAENLRRDGDTLRHA
jgi:hypothetical protein